MFNWGSSIFAGHIKGIMKKTFILLSLLYTAHNFSMCMTKKLAIAAAATAPVTIPAAYHGYTSMRHAEKGAPNTFLPFVGGTVGGSIPLWNIFIALGMGRAIVGDTSNMTYQQAAYKRRQQEAISQGIMGGLCLHLTLPFALDILRKLKIKGLK
jgi:hypothetical protein